MSFRKHLLKNELNLHPVFGWHEKIEEKRLPNS